MGLPAPKRKRKVMSVIEYIGNVFSPKGNRLVFSKDTMNEIRQRRMDAENRVKSHMSRHEERKADSKECQSKRIKTQKD